MSGGDENRSGASRAELERELDRLRRLLAKREAELERIGAGDRIPPEYLRYLSHQLRGPLTGIILWTDLLRADLALADADSATEAFDAIRDAAKALMDIIDNLREPGVPVIPGMTPPADDAGPSGTPTTAEGAGPPGPPTPAEGAASPGTPSPAQGAAPPGTQSPAEDAGPPAAPPASAGAADPAAPASRRYDATVLIAEDVPETRQALATVLAARGFRVLEATDGEDAVRLAGVHRPDVVLMDIAMPRVDGISALERLRADPGTAKLPVAAVTARVMSDDRQRMEAAGFDAFLVKPFRIAEVLEVLDRLLALGGRPAAPA